MITNFCPKCWAGFTSDERICPECGYVLEQFDAMLFEDKLITALHHVLPERQIMAAQILGNQNSVKALPEFLKIIRSGEQDYFFVRAILQATAKINHPDRMVILKEASQNNSRLISNLARELLTRLETNDPMREWDRNTG